MFSFGFFFTYFSFLLKTEILPTYRTHLSEISKRLVFHSKMSVLIVCLDAYKILSTMKSLME